MVAVVRPMNGPVLVSQARENTRDSHSKDTVPALRLHCEFKLLAALFVTDYVSSLTSKCYIPKFYAFLCI